MDGQGHICQELYLLHGCNDAVVLGDNQHWFTLSSFAKATSKETSLSADCYFLPTQMKSDQRTDNNPAGSLLEFFVRTWLASRNSGHVHGRELIGH